MRALPTCPTGLYWSTNGHVACPDHAAAIPDDRWWRDGWAFMPTTSQGVSGRYYQCEYCSTHNVAFQPLPCEPLFHVS